MKKQGLLLKTAAVISALAMLNQPVTLSAYNGFLRGIVKSTPLSCGDINFNGKVNVFDLIHYKQELGSASFGKEADTYKDGKYDFKDIYTLKRFLLRDIDSLPVKADILSVPLNLKLSADSLLTGEKLYISAMPEYEGDYELVFKADGTVLKADKLTSVFTSDTAGSFVISVEMLVDGEVIASEKASVEITVPKKEIVRTVFEIGLDVNGGVKTAELDSPMNVRLNVIAEETELESASVMINDTRIELDENGNGTFLPTEEGSYNVTAEACSSSGIVKKASATVYACAPSETIPTISISSPADSAEITGPVDVIGTVSGDGLVYYTLEYSKLGKEEYTVFAEGHEAVTEGCLGTLDTTMLENGTYDLRLTAFGGSKNKSIQQTIVVKGNMKLGNFDMLFKDADVSVGGLPMSLNRVYDTKNKDISGDFGYGWDLSLSNVKLTESCTPGMYWQRNSGFLGIRGYFTEIKTHEITIDWGNNQTDTFAVKASNGTNVSGGVCDIEITFEPTNGTEGTLTAVDALSHDMWYMGGDKLTEDPIDGSGRVYDPSVYKLTKPDGSSYVISEETGIKEINDVNGNTITISNNSITNSNGKEFLFTRDEEKRITEIILSPASKLLYEYNKYGDLIKFTDVSGAQTNFIYDEHYLTEIIDARGIRACRNEYDDEGRLSAVYDANGDAVKFDNDIEGRRQTVTDRNGCVTVYTYDEKGNIISRTDALSNTTYSEFDENSNKISDTDALGHKIVYDYSGGRLVMVFDSNGKISKTEYNGSGNVSKITTMDEVQLVVNYNANGTISSTVDANGNTDDYSFDKQGRVVSISDKIGSILNVQYDEDGNVKSEIDGNGNISSYTYDENGKCLSKSIQAAGSSESTEIEIYQYDSAQRLSRITYSDNSFISFIYNEIGKVSETVDSMNRKTKYNYDIYGNTSKIIYADNTFEIFEYDPVGNNTKSVDRLGITVNMEYDKVGNLVKKIYSDGTFEAYKYDAAYRVIEQTNVYGGVTLYSYDEYNHITEKTTPSGSVYSYKYNMMSFLESLTDPMGNTYSYEYDNNGNRKKIILPDGNSLTCTYDERNHMSSYTDQNGYTTRYHYDKNDGLSGITDSLNGEWKYSCDEFGNVTEVCDANGNSTFYEYDVHNNICAIKDMNGSTEKFEYNLVGNVTKHTDKSGAVTQYEFDSNDMLVRSVSDSSKTEFKYYPNGLIRSVSDKNGTTSYEYSELCGKVSRVTKPDGKTISYSYGSGQNISEIKTEYGSTEYAYDAEGRITEVKQSDGIILKYTYDKNGNKAACEYSNGIKTVYGYDSMNRLVSVKNTDKSDGLISEYKYTLGKAGERLTAVEPECSIKYTYDELYRLTGETITYGSGKTSSSTYKYDAAGNRTEKSVDGKNSVYTYNKLNQLESDGEYSYRYDVNGNTISIISPDKTSIFEYDESNRMISAKITQNGITVTEEYTYDWQGNRISKTIDGKTTNYLVDTNCEFAQTLAEFDKDGKLTVYYTKLNDEMLSAKYGSGDIFFIYDGHGSVRQLTDNDGKITDTYGYDAFGKLITHTGESANSFMYAGEQYDANTGFYYLRARYMNPSSGTFTSLDTYQGNVFDPITLHKYTYANANPTYFTDPSGHSAQDDSETPIEDTLTKYGPDALMDMLLVYATNIQTVQKVIADTAIPLLGITAVAEVGAMFFGPLGLLGNISSSISGKLYEIHDQLCIQAAQIMMALLMQVKVQQLVCFINMAQVIGDSFGDFSLFSDTIVDELKQDIEDAWTSLNRALAMWSATVSLCDYIWSTYSLFSSLHSGYTEGNLGNTILQEAVSALVS